MSLHWVVTVINQEKKDSRELVIEENFALRNLSYYRCLLDIAIAN